jgi:hypothetical protein
VVRRFYLIRQVHAEEDVRLPLQVVPEWTLVLRATSEGSTPMKRVRLAIGPLAFSLQPFASEEARQSRGGLTGLPRLLEDAGASGHAPRRMPERLEDHLFPKKTPVWEAGTSGFIAGPLRVSRRVHLLASS